MLQAGMAAMLDSQIRAAGRQAAMPALVLSLIKTSSRYKMIRAAMPGVNTVTA